MLSKATRPRVSRSFLLLLAVLIGLAAVGCSGAPSRGWSGPLVSDNVLYVGTLQGKILAYDLVIRDQKWVEPVAKQTGRGFGCSGSVSIAMGIYGTPAFRDDKLYVGAYDGIVLWVSRDGESVSRSNFDTGGQIIGSVTIDGDTLYVGNSDGKVYALDLNAADLANSLREGWPFKTGGEIWSTPVVKDKVVYVASADHCLYAIDSESGHEIWRFETEAAIMSTPLVDSGTVYIGGCDRKFYSVDAATEDERVAAAGGASPTVRQSKEVFEGASNWFWTQALAYNGQIWVGCLDHKVYVLDAETLDYVTEIKTGGMVYTPPVLFPSEGLVVVGSQDGKIYAIDAETKNVSVYAIDAETEEVVASPEKPKNRLPPIFAPLFADTVNGIVYFHSQDGTHTLYAFKLSTQEVLWSFRTDKIK